MVTNNIYGSAAVAIGPGASQLVSSVAQGDLGSLLAAALAAGLTGNGISELESAIQADGGAAPGSRVTSFLGKLAVGAGQGAGQIFTGAAGGVISELVRAYYGI